MIKMYLNTSPRFVTKDFRKYSRTSSGLGEKDKDYVENLYSKESYGPTALCEWMD